MLGKNPIEKAAMKKAMREINSNIKKNMRAKYPVNKAFETITKYPDQKVKITVHGHGGSNGPVLKNKSIFKDYPKHEFTKTPFFDLTSNKNKNTKIFNKAAKKNPIKINIHSQGGGGGVNESLLITKGNWNNLSCQGETKKILPKSPSLEIKGKVLKQIKKNLLKNCKKFKGEMSKNNILHLIIKEIDKDTWNAIPKKVRIDLSKEKLYATK